MKAKNEFGWVKWEEEGHWRQRHGENQGTRPLAWPLPLCSLTTDALQSILIPLHTSWPGPESVVSDGLCYVTSPAQWPHSASKAFYLFSVEATLIWPSRLTQDSSSQKALVAWNVVLFLEKKRATTELHQSTYHTPPRWTVSNLGAKNLLFLSGSLANTLAT